ncbi:hypothetical protein [Streptomyces sp. NPDC002328]|uniref:hypothetical protein n=1 Tax=Streptomyces sp. NPDC002328 TaxID=3364642 RepID=UPI003696E721
MTTQLPTRRPASEGPASRRGLRARLAVLGTVAAAALSVLASAGMAHAGFYVSLQTHSNVRTAPSTGSGVVVNTGSTPNRYYMDGVCYVHGQRVTAGGYTTDVWYRGTVHDSVIPSPGPYNHVWVWGGNVNVGQDPADSVDLC